jgi:putative ABC transport system ATP-binding protein
MNLMNPQNRLYNENRELKRMQRVAIFGIDKGFEKGEPCCRGERTGRKNESEEKVSESVIRIVDLWKAYNHDGTDMPALRGTSLDVKKGEIIALFGKSGSGKSTLFNLIAGLDRPTRGRIEIDGQDLETLREKGRTTLRRMRLGFVFQFFNLLPTLTAFENIFLSLELAAQPDPDVALLALEEVGLKGKEHRYPHELSGGEQQRVAIARAFVKRPSLILADEPTGNLDTVTGNQILDLLTRRCREFGTTLIMATHSPLTCQYAGRLLRMVDGLIVEETSREGANR